MAPRSAQRPARSAGARTPAKKAAPAARPTAKKAAPKPAVKAPAKKSPAPTPKPKVPAPRSAQTQGEPAQIAAHDVVRAFSAFLNLFTQYSAQEHAEYAAVIDAHQGAPAKSPIQKARVAGEPVIGEVLDKDRTMAMSAVELRELAEKFELDERMYKSKILAELEDKGFFRGSDDSTDDGDDSWEEGDDDEDTEEDDGEDDSGAAEHAEDLEDEEGDDDDEEEVELSIEDLQAKTLSELRKIARDNDIDPSGLDKDAIIEAITEGDEEEGDEEEDSAYEDEDEDEEDGEGLSAEDILAMTHKQLMGVAEQLEFKVPAKLRASNTANKKALADLIIKTYGTTDE